MEKIVSRVEKIKNGGAIVNEGTSAYYAYIMKEGKAKVFKNIDGKQVLIGNVNEGDVFGEMAFFGSAERTASVIADGDVKVEMIARDTFNEFLDKLPREVRAKLDVMVGDLTSITEVCSRLAILFKNIQNIETKIIDVKTFEREVGKMPEFMRCVATAMVKRLNKTVEELTKLAAHVEEAVKAVDPLSLTVPPK